MFRFGNAVTAADRAQRIDQFSTEVIAIKTNVLMADRARMNGYKHYESGEYMKACDEYKIGLKYAKSNRLLLTNLADCHWKMERWTQCIEICNQVLRSWPKNSKALLLCADSYTKVTN
jgi:tetratricopeptide (TPR) repeat protein